MDWIEGMMWENEILTPEMRRQAEAMNISISDDPLMELFSTMSDDRIKTLINRGRVELIIIRISSKLMDLLRQRRWGYWEEWDSKEVAELWAKIGFSSRCLGLLHWYRGDLWSGQKMLALSMNAFRQKYLWYPEEVLKARMLLARLIEVDPRDDDELTAFLKETAFSNFANWKKNWMSGIYAKGTEAAREGRLEEALFLEGEAIELGDVMCEGSPSHEEYAKVQIRLGDLEGAERSLDEDLIRWDANNNDRTRIIRRSMWTRAQLMIAKGDAASVEPYLLSILRAARRTYKWEEVMFNLTMTDARSTLGEYQEARTSLERARRILDTSLTLGSGREYLESKYHEALEKLNQVPE